MSTVTVRAYRQKDIPAMTEIWNEVVEDGIAFPQTDILSETEAEEFFSGQTYCCVAENENGEVLGLYILHPNNIGRCGHISNASFAVKGSARGEHIGEKLVLDCKKQAHLHGFTLLQFNAVVKSNIHARHLYERCGFIPLGTIPHGFLMKDGHFEDICIYYTEV